MTRFVHIHNLDIPSATSVRVKYCESYLCRLRGLTLRKPLALDEGLLLVQKSDSRLDASIHMLGVSFDLAVIWIDSSLTVVDKVLAKSWRPAYAPQKGAKYILEIHSNHLDDYSVGNKLEIQDA